jgi:hypothetical protein
MSRAPERARVEELLDEESLAVLAIEPIYGRLNGVAHTLAPLSFEPRYLFEVRFPSISERQPLCQYL